MCTSLEFVSAEEEEDKLLTFKVSHMWVSIFSFRKERLRGEKTTKAGRKDGGRGWEVREVSCPTKMDTMSSFADMLADYGSCHYCLHVLMYSTIPLSYRSAQCIKLK